MTHHGRTESQQWYEFGHRNPRSLDAACGEDEDGSFDGALSNLGEVQMGKKWVDEWESRGENDGRALRFNAHRITADWPEEEAKCMNMIGLV